MDGEQLLWASAGCLYRAPIDADHGVGSARLLHDFSGMTFEPIAAPY